MSFSSVYSVILPPREQFILIVLAVVGWQSRLSLYWLANQMVHMSFSFIYSMILSSREQFILVVLAILVSGWQTKLCVSYYVFFYLYFV